MGPTNVALVQLFQADTALRQANERYESAAKTVRIQERRINELIEKLKVIQTSLREAQVRGSSFELDVKSRDEHIEKLRQQQQNAKNNREYQALLTEINTGKLDKGKVEEETIKVMELAEKLNKEAADLTAQLDEERKKTEVTRAQLAGKLEAYQKDVDALKPVRAAAAAAVPARARDLFERLADRHEGEALSALAKPDPRTEEYICTACNMSLVTDVYNRLHDRDELVFCPSCQRILYIPDDLPPEMAVKGKGGEKKPARAKAAGEKKPRSTTRKVSKATKASTASEVATEDGASVPAGRKKAKSPWADLLRRAQGESVKNAVDAEAPPVECDVFIDGKLEGVYKGKSVENFERVTRFILEESGRTAEVKVTEHAGPETATAPDAPVEGSVETPGVVSPSIETPTVETPTGVAPAVTTPDIAAAAPALPSAPSSPPAVDAISGAAPPASTAPAAPTPDPVKQSVPVANDIRTPISAPVELPTESNIETSTEPVGESETSEDGATSAVEHQEHQEVN